MASKARKHRPTEMTDPQTAEGRSLIGDLPAKAFDPDPKLERAADAILESAKLNELDEAERRALVHLGWEPDDIRDMDPSLGRTRIEKGIGPGKAPKGPPKPPKFGTDARLATETIKNLFRKVKLDKIAKHLQITEVPGGKQYTSGSLWRFLESAKKNLQGTHGDELVPIIEELQQELFANPADPTSTVTGKLFGAGVKPSVSEITSLKKLDSVLRVGKAPLQDALRRALVATDSPIYETLAIVKGPEDSALGLSVGKLDKVTMGLQTKAVMEAPVPVVGTTGTDTKTTTTTTTTDTGVKPPAGDAGAKPTGPTKPTGPSWFQRNIADRARSAGSGVLNLVRGAVTGGPEGEAAFMGLAGGKFTPGNLARAFGTGAGMLGAGALLGMIPRPDRSIEAFEAQRRTPAELALARQAQQIQMRQAMEVLQQDPARYEAFIQNLGKLDNAGQEPEVPGVVKF